MPMKATKPTVKLRPQLAGDGHVLHRAGRLALGLCLPTGNLTGCRLCSRTIFHGWISCYFRHYSALQTATNCSVGEVNGQKGFESSENYSRQNPALLFLLLLFLGNRISLLWLLLGFWCAVRLRLCWAVFAFELC